MYIGKIPSRVPLTSSDLADDIRTNPKPLEPKSDTIKRIRGDN